MYLFVNFSIFPFVPFRVVSACILYPSLLGTLLGDLLPAADHRLSGPPFCLAADELFSQLIDGKRCPGSERARGLH